MRMTTLATIVSSVLLGAATAHAGDAADNQKAFEAADTDRDSSISLTEAQTGMPKLAEKFSAVDANADGKVSADEMTAYQKAHQDKSMDSDQPTNPTTDTQSTTDK